MIDSLRNFKVTLIDGKKTEFVTAHRHSLGPNAAVMFQVDTMDGTYIRSVYLPGTVQKVEEIVNVDSVAPARHDN